MTDTNEGSDEKRMKDQTLPDRYPVKTGNFRKQTEYNTSPILNL